MFTITERSLRGPEGIIEEILREEEAMILDKGILVSKVPILALGMKGDCLLLMEDLSFGGEVVDLHMDWIKKNEESLKKKYNLSFEWSYVDLIGIYLKKDTLRLRINSELRNIKVYTLKEDNGSKLVEFSDYLFNVHLIEEFSEKIQHKDLRRKFKEIIKGIQNERPLICRAKSDKVLMINGHWFYLQKDFFWYQKGKSPFKPRIFKVKRGIT
jgi:hypothetical protein